MNRTTKIVSVVLLLVFAGIAILSVAANVWFGQERKEQRESGSLNNWQTFQHEAFDFTFKYPAEAVTDISDPAIAGEPERVRVRLIGPESEPNTEITDGFTFYLSSDSLDQHETFSEAAKRVYKEETERREVIDEPANSEVKGREAYRFSLRSELGGEVAYTVIKGEEKLVFITTSAISTPKGTDRGYGNMIDKMKESLQKRD